MILRITILLSLVTIFYYYCKSDDQIISSSPDGRYQMDVPSQKSPIYNYELMPGNSMNSDSSLNYISVRQTYQETFYTESGLLTPN